jgi:rod shape-determining protein MreD
MGQHALSYTILAYAGIALARRVKMFGPAAQMVHVIPLFLLNDVIVVGIRMLSGAEFPGYRYYISAIVAGALWPAVALLLKLPQRPRENERG